MNKIIYNILLIALLHFMSLRTVNAQLSPAFTARLDKVFDSVCVKLKIKGASAALLVPGVGVWKGVHGISNANTPIQSDMIFGIGSNTKTLVSCTMLRLQEDGLVNLDDSIGQWIINKKNISGQITIRQLLNHSSGLFDYTQNPNFNDSALNDLNRKWKKEELLSLVNAPNFKPGASWDYSNTNYVLAGIIIEKVTGKTIQEAIRTYVLEPSNLNHTFYIPFESGSFTRAKQWSVHFGVKNLVNPEDYMSGYSINSMYSMASSAGAYMQTAEDNVQFWHLLCSGKIISQNSFDQMRQYINIGSGVGYGLGVFFYGKSLNGRSFYNHGGTFIGYINENMVDTTSKICISVLTNQDSIDNNRLLGIVVASLHKVTLQTKATGIATIEDPTEFTLYPNPSSEFLQVKTNQDITGYTLNIYDVNGKLQLTQHLDCNDQNIRIDQLENATYIACINNREGEVVCRTQICIMH